MLENDQDRLEILEAIGEKISLNNIDIFAIFDAEYFESLDGPGISSASPVISCRTSDAKNISQGSIVRRENGDQYTTREVEPDGTGLTLIRLRDYG